ncbi:MAG: 16S rRNA (adenine(1518)-N(6)/adenine(1519)-N(6))-dimethyltransferase RsmA [Eubacterium sp.]|nr:16S rRNA (adenine(1518)-N(6)/adenine(1519)-N(6))-dimethyltransferase RsmA [Eubacterium sp.]
MDYNLCDRQTVERLLKKHGFTFSKAMGQNFLIDGSVCPAMAAALHADETTGVLEIGPGIGVLTKELCRVAGKVTAVELDKRLFPLLAETLGDYPQLSLVEGDILHLDLPALLTEHFDGCSRIKVCANLPYYITSPVIMTLLESHLPVDELVVMVQKEAAERLCAPVGTREAGAVSVAVQYYGESEILFEVGRESFLPAPKVDSAVIRIRLRQEPLFPLDSEKQFFTFVKAAFSQRRKTLVNSVSGTLHLPKDEVLAALAALSLPAGIRAEQLTMEDFAGLYNALQR